LLIPELKEFVNLCSSSAEFYARLTSIFVEIWTESTIIFLQHERWQNFQALEGTWLSKCREIFESKLKEEAFVDSLSRSIDCYSKMAKTAGIGLSYQYLSNLSSLLNNYFFEAFRDTIWRTPSHKIHSEGKFALFHYNHTVEKLKNRAPVLIVYAFINRYYILDLLPEVSIVRSLLNRGLDLFAADWGTPSANDKDLTLDYYVNNYLDKSVDKIREHSDSEKTSIFGYCWGGDLALIYAARHPEKVKNVITLATPVDFSLDNGLLSMWTKKINVESLVDAFGNAPSMMLNTAFALRSPVDYLHKYPHFFEKPRDVVSIMEFLATELWLYDSPPVIGEIYREIVKDCYQENLLINNRMKIGNRQIVNLKNITIPLLNIFARKDDLVAPNSSKALNDAVGSNDKSLMEFNSGHVGTCISSPAHRELWPKVGEWIANHS
jgi:polyhydroxyalkanoate synthase